MCDELGYGIGDPDTQLGRPSARLARKRLSHLAAESEDLVCVAKHDAPMFGEDEPAPNALEELLIERAFEGTNLCADRRRSQPQRLARLRDRAFLSDGVEVVEVVVVQPFHRGAIIRQRTRAAQQPRAHRTRFVISR